MWKLVARIDEDAWADARDLAGAQVAEIARTQAGWKHEPLRMIVRRTRYSAAQISANQRARRRKTIHPDQLAMLLDGHAGIVYGYSFILTDIHHAPAAQVEHFHRHRAQIEERLKDAKLGQALRRMPCADRERQPHLARGLPARAEPHRARLRPVPGRRRVGQSAGRRAAQADRQDPAWLLFRVPARVSRSARQTILHLHPATATRASSATPTTPR